MLASRLTRRACAIAATSYSRLASHRAIHRNTPHLRRLPMREAVHNVTQPCLREPPWPNDPARFTADSRCRHFDDFGPVLVSPLGSAARSSVATSRINSHAGHTSHIHSGRAHDFEEVGWRCGRLIVSPSHGDRLPQQRLFAVDHRRSSSRARRSRPRVHRSRPAPRPPKRRSDDPVPAVPADARPGRPTPHAVRQLLTHPTPLLLARIPTHRLNARRPIGSHFDGRKSVSRSPTDF